MLVYKIMNQNIQIINKTVPFAITLHVYVLISGDERRQSLHTNQLVSIVVTRNTCMQQPLALIGIQGTIFSEHEVFRVHDFEIVFIFTLSIFFKKCENNESIISFNYKIHNLHKFFS